MKYHVVVSSSLEDLKGRVNLYLKEGWVPQGGISMCPVRTEINTIGSRTTSQIQYTQAVTLSNPAP